MIQGKTNNHAASWSSGKVQDSGLGSRSSPGVTTQNTLFATYPMSPRARDVIASRGRKSRSGPGACWPTSLSAHQQWRMQQARIQLRFSGGRKCPFWGSFCSLVVSQSEERGERSCWNSVSGPTTWICHRNGLTMMTLNMTSWHARCPAGGFHIHRPSRRHGKPICAAFHEHRWWVS